MKKILTSVLAIALIAVMLCSLVSCGNKPSGEYENLVSTLIFKGNKVTLEIGNAEIATGTFSVDDEGKIEIVVEDEDSDTKDKWPSGLKYDKENDEIKAGILTWKKAD